MQSPASRTVAIVLAVAVAAVVAYLVLTMPDHRTTSQRIGDAFEELPQGVDRAARQLEDRTPAEKMGDTVKDNIEDRKDPIKPE